MEPASKIIAALGGPAAVAEEIGVHRTSIYQWQKDKDKRGTGGLIPSWHIPRLMQMSERVGAGLKPADFFPVPESESAVAK